MGAMRSKLAFLLVFLASGPALAQQLVTFDQVITITQQGNGSGAFHYTIKPAASEPASWTTPGRLLEGHGVRAHERDGEAEQAEHHADHLLRRQPGGLRLHHDARLHRRRDPRLEARVAVGHLAIQPDRLEPAPAGVPPGGQGSRARRDAGRAAGDGLHAHQDARRDDGGSGRRDVHAAAGRGLAVRGWRRGPGRRHRR